ncbi:hypothetical protein HXX76_009464 [Chlamydomonas incerta]|uniref:Glycosyl transferase CAP10 domain-containing protein n=1 Tax=Chlamydomonas incerta TaxID=51695 RepID=A0A835T075_CHLIN|nr:hypothetical protein HXX76_009464 [Chlamydomonas incerta]|eukprot:KAG2431449.1 hypothetical protein HXX76_009464 [Chlamydomonas incerta]
MGWPHQMNPDFGDFTLLMPSLYTDLDRDAMFGKWKPYTSFSYPWEKKKNVAFFRGSGYCNMWHRNKVVKCPRWHLTNESYYNGHGDLLDVRINGWDEGGVGRKCPPYDQVPLRELPRYKFLLSLDGVSASNRFAKLLGMNSVVLKEDSPYMGWFYRSVRPYEHYLPILERHPLDVLDAIGVYAGPHRDNELKRIVRNANNFAAKYMCDRAIALYFRKVLTEYKKLFDDMDGFIQGYIWPLVQAKQKTHVDFRQHLGRLRRQIAEDEAAAAAAAAKVAGN